MHVIVKFCKGKVFAWWKAFWLTQKMCLFHVKWDQKVKNTYSIHISCMLTSSPSSIYGFKRVKRCPCREWQFLAPASDLPDQKLRRLPCSSFQQIWKSNGSAKPQIQTAPWCDLTVEFPKRMEVYSNSNVSTHWIILSLSQWAFKWVKLLILFHDFIWICIIGASGRHNNCVPIYRIECGDQFVGRTERVYARHGAMSLLNPNPI